MLVVNTQPFDLVYSLVNHPYLGFIIEPHVVQVNSLGKFTLTHQRIFSKTASDFNEKIDRNDSKIIKLLDELDDEYIFKRFHSDTKKKIKKHDFFNNEKYCTETFFTEHIQPFIEQRLNKVLNLLRGKTIYKMGNDNNPASQKINVSDEKASVLFHFRRNEEGTRYFPTIKFKGERIEFMYKGAQIISNHPAWMLLNNVIFDFEKEVDGKKLQPFLNKRFIQIAPNAEENYFNKFATQLIERYDVYAEGFTIQTEKASGVAVLKVQPYESDKLSLKLVFNYDRGQFEYGSADNVRAVVEKKNNDYVFKRIKRDRHWEEEQKQLIEKMGLLPIFGAYFTLHSKAVSLIAEQLIPPETTNKYEFLEWMNDSADTLKSNGISIEQSDEFNKYYIGSREIKLEVKEQKDWFDIKATVKFGEFVFPFIALKENILKGKREFILPNGLIAIIPDEWFGNLAGMLEFSASAEDIQLEKHHIGLIEELTQEGGKYLRISDKLDKIKEYGTAIKEMPLPQNFKGDLRPYQKAGFDWFYFLKENKFGGCLADDMGLGKTIQTLALLQKEKELFIQTGGQQKLNEQLPQLISDTQPQLSLFNPNEQHKTTQTSTEKPQAINDAKKTFIKTSLIIVPNSLVYNWHNEAGKFTPNIKTLIYTGIHREKNPQMFLLYDLVITTYGTVRVDIDILKEFKFNYIILDESQSIKNPNSQASRAVKQLKASHKLVLTGTPIENSIQELWSQLSFINPGLVGGLQAFTEKFVTPIEKANDTHKMQQLKAIIKPFVLRRTKDQVAQDLPPKMEQVVYCNMSEEQAEAYETVKSHFRNEILKSIQDIGLNKSQFVLLQGLTKLRQIANHPKMTNENFEGVSGKFEDVLHMAETAKSEGHKVLIFSQFVKQLDIYRKQFDENGWQYSYLDGTLNNEQRQKAVEEFQRNNDIKFFLISLKAGGVGLNLTAADYVFIIDPWWNPAVEQQAIDRTHRIGQDKTVFTYKFISRNTVEEKILALQYRKKELASSIITTEENFIKSIDVDEILEILS